MLQGGAKVSKLAAGATAWLRFRNDALPNAWRQEPSHGERQRTPFIYDTARDCIRIVDWIETRDDVDAEEEAYAKSKVKSGSQEELQALNEADSFDSPAGGPKRKAATPLTEVLQSGEMERLRRELKEMRKLMLSNNRLGALPRSMAALTELELLRLANNRLRRLPEWLHALPRLTWLALAGNPCVEAAPPRPSRWPPTPPSRWPTATRTYR